MITLKKAVKLALEQKIHAIVTAPINKALHIAGKNFPGHTENLGNIK